MKQTTSETQTFPIDYKGNSYTCAAFERKGAILYRVIFNKSYLYLTQATAADGTIFWTPIPADSRLDPLVQDLGKIIENHFK